MLTRSGEPTIYRFRDKKKVVDRGLIGFIMVIVLVSKAVDHGFIGVVMVSVLVSKAVDHGFIGGRLAFFS
jgi:hypothetical protein